MEKCKGRMCMQPLGTQFCLAGCSNGLNKWNSQDAPRSQGCVRMGNLGLVLLSPSRRPPGRRPAAATLAANHSACRSTNSDP